MSTDPKRVLLIHPLGYEATAAARDITRLANLMPPLGLASIAAYLDQQGMDADLVDCMAWPDSDGHIRQLLREKRPAWVGISCTTSSLADGVRVARLAREELPDVKTVFGGPHVSALREAVLREHPEIDCLICGEGEEALLELMLSNGEHLDQISGLVYREGDEIRFSGYRTQGIALDDLPFPAYEKLRGYPDAYKLPIFNYPRNPSASCISSRGCPYQCSYCDRSVFRKSFRFNSAEYLYEHLLYLHQRWGIRHINFYDDQFTFQRRRVVDFCNMMIANPLGITFNCAVRAEHIDPELLQLMKEAGCWMISLGVETGDPELLARHRQNSDLDLLAQRIREIKAAGIRTKGLLMMGLPGETETSIQRSIDYVLSLPIDDFNLTKFTPFPGSPIYENIRQYGTFDEDPSRMDCMHFLFVPDGFTVETLEEWYAKFYVAHYRRPKIIADYIRMLWRSPDSWRRFLCDLPSFLRYARSSKRIRES